MDREFNEDIHRSVEGVESTLSIRDFNLWYGDFQALKSITLEIPKNRAPAFIGPSGCGKWTLLRTFNRMCMVFQHPNPFPMSIRENVLYGVKRMGRMSRSEEDEILERCLTRAALWDEVKDKLGQSGLGLSGGQQQRLCIARALATDPSVLLMDEPTSALDPISTSMVEELMMQLSEDHTVVVVTHNMQQAARVADKTCFFYLGELVEAAPTKELFSNPKEKLTNDYLTGRFS